MDDFMQEIQKPTTDAVGTSAPAGPAPVYDFTPPPPPPSPEEQRAPDEPMFRPEDTKEQPAPGTAPTERSTDYKRKMVRTLIIGEDFATSRICGIVAGSDEYSLFKYTEDDINTILDLLEPYYDVILEKVPAWIPLVMVYGGLKTQQIMTAAKIFKTNKANAAARTDKTVLEKVATAAGTEEQKERTRFKINKSGEYTYDRYGAYVKEGEPREKADMKDIDRILESNKPSLVKEAFHLSDEFLIHHGVEL